MSAEHSVIAEQNALAQSVRGKAVTAAVVAAAAQTPSAGLRQPTTVSQIGAFAQSPAPSNQHIATTAWKPTPGIFLVNGKARGFTVTPGGYLTIAGYGLGNNAGEVGLFGSTNPNRIGLQVVTWGDGEVYALLPAGLRGVPDQEMKLQVVTREGKTYLLEGALFHATREEVAVTNHLDRVYRLEPAASWAANVVFENASGEIMRGEMGESVTCRAPGTDRIVFLPLPNGFEVTGLSMQHGHTDSGDGDMYGGAGNRMFFPGYSLGDWRDETVATDRLRSSVQSVLYVNWGVWRSHSSPIFPIKAVDFCMSSYTITGVTAIGPAGVAVF